MYLELITEVEIISSPARALAGLPFGRAYDCCDGRWSLVGRDQASEFAAGRLDLPRFEWGYTQKSENSEVTLRMLVNMC